MQYSLRTALVHFAFVATITTQLSCSSGASDSFLGTVLDASLLSQRSLLYEQPPTVWAQALRALLTPKVSARWRVLTQELVLPVDAEVAAQIQTLQQSAADPDMEAMINCINARHVPGSSGLTWEEAMADQMENGSLKAYAAFWTSKPGFSTTVVTSASVNRLTQLYAQCKTFSGNHYMWLPSSDSMSRDQ
jgi:hypothetical protein